MKQSNKHLLEIPGMLLSAACWAISEDELDPSTVDTSTSTKKTNKKDKTDDLLSKYKKQVFFTVDVSILISEEFARSV